MFSIHFRYHLALRCKSEKKLMMLMSMDMDGLKKINDVYGYCALWGDEFIAAGILSKEEAEYCQKQFFCSLTDIMKLRKTPIGFGQAVE